MDKIRCLIYDSNFNKDFWGDAVLTAIYLNNRTEISTLPKGCTPAEIWYNCKPNLKKIHVFGYLSYAHIPKEERNGKLDPYSKKMYLIGYCHNGYRLWDPDRKTVITSRLYLKARI